MPDRKESPSQTAGPYVHIGCVPTFAGLSGMYGGADPGARMITGEPEGERIDVTFLIIDGQGEALRDAMIEIWQPGPDGDFGPTEGFCHWGRRPTSSDTGEATFTTLKPGRSGQQAPHILVWIAARGINLALTTRLYFPDEDNDGDPVLRLAGARAPSLVAEKMPGGYRHVIHLQGTEETVFFDV